MRKGWCNKGLDVLPDGTRDILGLWIENTEGAKFWMKVFSDLKVRGVQDILIAVTDGLKGMPEALGAVFAATTLQTCIVHLTATRWITRAGKTDGHWRRPSGRSIRRRALRLLRPNWTHSNRGMG